MANAREARVDHVTAAIGRSPIIYAGYYSWQDYTGNANLTSSPLWHAQYTDGAVPLNIPTPWTDVDVLAVLAWLAPCRLVEKRDPTDPHFTDGSAR